MNRIDVFKEIFTTDTTCDFCNRENRIIMHATIHPLYKWTDAGSAHIQGVAIAKKCMTCIEEDSNE